MNDEHGSRRPDHAGKRSAQNGSHDMPSVLPAPSQAPHITITGGLLGGTDVLRVGDTSMAAPKNIEVGARVELHDGTRARVVKVRGKHLSGFGILEGSVNLELADGTVVSKPNRNIARVIAAAGQD